MKTTQATSTSSTKSLGCTTRTTLSGEVHSLISVSTKRGARVGRQARKLPLARFLMSVHKRIHGPVQGRSSLSALAGQTPSSMYEFDRPSPSGMADLSATFSPAKSAAKPRNSVADEEQACREALSRVFQTAAQSAMDAFERFSHTSNSKAERANLELEHWAQQAKRFGAELDEANRRAQAAEKASEECAAAAAAYKV